MRGLQGMLNKIVPTPAELRDLGWATAGGAVGTLAVQYGARKIREQFKLDFLAGYKNDILDVLTGGIIDRVTRGWNETFAHGAVGATAGRAVAKIALRLLNQPALSQLPEDQVLSAFPSDQIGPPSDELSLEKYFTSEGDFTEVEAEPQFTGFGGDTVEAETPQFGAYLA